MSAQGVTNLKIATFTLGTCIMVNDPQVTLERRVEIANKLVGTTIESVDGAIDTLLAEVAGFYEREVDYDIKNLSQAIEPILIAVLAVFVLIFALGVFLPLWDLATVKIRQG